VVAAHLHAVVGVGDRPLLAAGGRDGSAAKARGEDEQREAEDRAGAKVVKGIPAGPRGELETKSGERSGFRWPAGGRNTSA
jgi:hypothetical protein